jgi:S-adenosylmethionine hydrolase
MPRRTPLPPAPRRRAEPAPVALLTDFGLAGHHAGVLRGVLLGLAPRVPIIDVTHGVPPGDVALGAWTLRWGWRWFPPGTVFLAVVDPGVGTARRALAAAAGGRFFVGPDNGLLGYALADAGDARVVALRLPRAGSGVSATFHGRDVFAPAASRLALGDPLEHLGAPTIDWLRLPEPRVRRVGPGCLEGEVIAVDHWGNLVTSLTAPELARAGIGGAAEVRIGRRVLRGIGRTYADAKAGGAVALLNSNGHLEIAMNGARADEALKAGRGTVVRVRAD